MLRAVLFDLFNTLVPGGSDTERRRVTRAMGRVLGVDPERYAEAFHASWPERFVGALGDLEDTVRMIAVQVGGAPPRARVSEAAALRRAMTDRLAPSVATVLVRPHHVSREPKGGGDRRVLRVRA